VLNCGYVAKKSTGGMTVSEAGRLGGIKRGEGLRAGTVRVSGAAVPIPTICPRCGVEQPSARQAWVHCRKPRTAKKKAPAKKAGKKGAK
jgi:hypothetical protein